MVEERAGDLRVAVSGDGDATVDATGRVVPVGVDDDPDVVVAAGERALIAFADDLPDAPVVPSWTGGGPSVVPPAALGRALRAAAAGEARVDEHPVLGVAVDGRATGRALLDTTLVTSDPARISEYAVHSDGECVESVRADGMTVATPLGSAGYARAAGGPLLAPGTGVVVAPIAPFTTTPNVRVLELDVTLSVERDDGPVSLVLDDTLRHRVEYGERVRVGRAGTFEVLHVPGLERGDDG